MSPYPTKTRLALLQAVADGNVREGATEDTDGHVWLVDDFAPPRKVTAAIAELERAGWVAYGEPGLMSTMPSTWRLTDLGCVVLHPASEEAFRDYMKLPPRGVSP